MPTQVQGLGLVDDQGNKSIVVNLSNARQMTNAEYQQLSQSQRTGAIIVTDYPIPEESDSVEVEGNGIKNIRTLLNELYTSIDSNKISDRSYIEYADSLWRLVVRNSSGYWFERSFTAGSNIYHGSLFIASDAINSSYYPSSFNNSGNSISDTSTTTIPDNGQKIILHYNYYTNQDIHTEYLASNCMMQDGSTSVEDMLTVKTLSGFDVPCYKYGKMIEAVIEVTPSEISHGSVIVAKVPRAHRILYMSLNMASGQSLNCVLENIPGENYARITSYFPGTVNAGRIDATLMYIGE